MNLEEIRSQVGLLTKELLSVARLEPGDIVVAGCSTSEIVGRKIGSAPSSPVASAVLEGILAQLEGTGLHLAVQCCEHLNRALVVEWECFREHRLTRVSVRPVPKAGGALAAMAMERFRRPVVVAAVQAGAGLDIGHTLIGMHLRPVVVPVRTSVTHVGQAPVVAARVRPPLIGGERAVYDQDDPGK